MNSQRQLPLCAWLLVALFAWTTNASTQQLPGVPRVTLLAGNDGVGGIEWQLPRDEPKPSFKQGGSVLLPPPPPQLPNTRPSPLNAGGDDAPGDAPRILARSLPGRRDGAAGVVQLTPLADAQRERVTALALTGARPGAAAWLVVASQSARRPLAGGLLGLVPERVIPLGPTDASGELLVRMPQGAELEGLVFQVVVREGRWASSAPLSVVSSSN
ncbi:MAG: hypothetical protein DHS20C15_20300 [Planctomycetota bacterium]|nr:MAG: hypothetical protein DHS20C15_20300 [Planctomycetota bacterium]